MPDEIVEIVAKELCTGDSGTGSRWATLMEEQPEECEEYRKDARSLLRLLAEKGCVRMVEDMGYLELDPKIRVAKYVPLLPEEKP